MSSSTSVVLFGKQLETKEEIANILRSNKKIWVIGKQLSCGSDCFVLTGAMLGVMDQDLIDSMIFVDTDLFLKDGEDPGRIELYPGMVTHIFEMSEHSTDTFMSFVDRYL